MLAFKIDRASATAATHASQNGQLLACYVIGRGLTRP